MGRRKTDWEALRRAVDVILSLHRQGVPKELALQIGNLPDGRRQVAKALLEDASATYPQLARQVGVHLGTIHTHLRRIRERHPGTYAALMALRRQGLAERHEAALRSAKEHTSRWFRKMRRMGYTYYGKGVWLP